MRYWWVNHKQTFTQEFEGGYIWSPKRNKNGAKNQSYDNMTRVRVGDIIFSFAGAQISAIGTITAQCKQGSKPVEFGNTGDNWNQDGWLVLVDWNKLSLPLRPKDHIGEIAPLLADKYAPIKPDGNGNQGCYLAEISYDLAQVLFHLTGYQPENIQDSNWQEENQQQQVIEADTSLTVTEREQLVNARRGQGKFRQNVEQVEDHCRLTGTTDKRFLIASHIKPWRDSCHQEKLDGNNGFLMAPHIDKLFDGGWISFSENGKILVADSSVSVQLKKWHLLDGATAGTFNDKQKQYLAYHRKHIFRGNP